MCQTTVTITDFAFLVFSSLELFSGKKKITLITNNQTDHS